MDNASFAPMLVIRHSVFNIDFYTKGLDAIELRRFSNDDGSIHVSELAINGTMFHLHEEGHGTRSPLDLHGVTSVVGLFVDDVDAVMQTALSNGAVEHSPVQDYDYGYRQGEFTDPFGHRWQIQKAI